jgi:fibronectin-binding autotransporter adhesin
MVAFASRGRRADRCGRSCGGALRNWSVLFAAVAGLGGGLSGGVNGGVARAQVSGTWLWPSGDNSWGLPENWAGGLIANDGGTATFTGAPAIAPQSAVVVLVPSSPTLYPLTLSGLVFDSRQNFRVTNTAAITVAATGLTVQVAATSPLQPNATSNSIGHEIANPLVTGAGGFRKTGAGSLRLTATSASSFTGGVSVTGGVLQFTADTQLGALANAVTVDNAGLRVTSAVNSSRAFAFTGSSSIETRANVGLTSGMTGSGVLTKTGANILALRGASTFSGDVVVRGGTLTLVNALGTLTSVPGFDVGGVLSLDNSVTGGVNNDRIGNAATVALRGAVLRQSSASATSSNEQFETLRISDSVSQVLIVPNAATRAEVTVNNLLRENRGTLYLRATNLAAVAVANSSRFTVATSFSGALVGAGGAAGTPNVSILPYVVGNATAGTAAPGSSFATRDPATGAFRVLDAATEYAIALGAVTNNLRVAANLVVPGGGATVNALLLTNTAASSPTVSGGMLNVTSGAVLVADVNAVGSAISSPLNFGAAEGIVHAYGVLKLQGPVGGSGGLTISGNSTVEISGGANASPYTGVTTIQGGTVTYSTSVNAGVNSPFGNSTTAINLQAGSQGNTALLAATGGGAVSMGRDLLVTGQGISNVIVGSTGGGVLTFTGGASLQRELSIDTTGGGTAVFTGSITGPGRLVDFSPGVAQKSVIVLAVSNNFSGGVLVQNGHWVFGNDNAAGSGTITLGSVFTAFLGTISATGGTVALPNAVSVTANFAVADSDSPGPLVLAGAVELNGSIRTLTHTGTTPLVLSGEVKGGGLAVRGTGETILTSNGNDLFARGPTRVDGGILRFGNGGATGNLGNNDVTVAAAGTVILDRTGSVTIPQSVRGQGQLTFRGGGTFAMTGTVALTGSAGNALVEPGTTLVIGDGVVNPAFTANVLDNQGATIFRPAGVLTFSGPLLTSLGRLEQFSPGTTVLAGSVTFGGPVRVRQGRLQLSDGGTPLWTVAGTNTFTVDSGATLAFARNDAFALATLGSVVGGGTLAQSGSGVLTLAGGVVVSVPHLSVTAGTMGIGDGLTGAAISPVLFSASPGTLLFNLPASAGYAAEVRLGGATLSQIGAGGVTFGALVLEGGTSTINGPGNVGFASASGAGALQVSGTGTVSFTAGLTHAGDTTILSGRVNIGAAILSSPQIVVADVARLDASAVVGGQTLSGSQTLTANGSVLGALVLAGGLVRRDGTGGPVLTADISGSGTVRQDAAGGTFTLTGALGYEGLTHVSADNAELRLLSALSSPTGVLSVTGVGSRAVLDRAAAPGFNAVVANVGAVSVSPTGSVVVPATNLSVNKARLLVTSGLSLSSSPPSFTSTLDLGNNDMIVRGGDLAGIRSAILAGLIGGTEGLIASQRNTGGRNNFATLGARLVDPGIGFPEFELFDGVAVVSSDVLVKYTYLGDVNLDGTLDATDFNTVLSGLTNALTGWHNGDVNYDGVIDTLDFASFVAAYAFVQGGGLPFDNSVVPAGAIPEPGAAMLVLAGLPLLRRRRA